MEASRQDFMAMLEAAGLEFLPRATTAELRQLYTEHKERLKTGSLEDDRRETERLENERRETERRNEIVGGRADDILCRRRRT